MLGTPDDILKDEGKFFGEVIYVYQESNLIASFLCFPVYINEQGRKKIGIRMKVNLLVIGIVLAGLMQCEFVFSQTRASIDINSEWNQYRGPNRDGLSSEKNLLNKWPTDGPEILWKVSVGDGYSGITLFNDRLFTMWDVEDSQFLFCLNALNGKELWRYQVDSNFVSSWGDGPMATPVVDDNIVYAVSAQGMLHAVNATDGKLAWKKDLEKEFGFVLPNYGYAPSPLVDGDKLFIQVGGRKSYTFLALNKKTGELIWHSSITDTPAYSSPIVVTVGEIRQVIFMSTAGLFCLSPEDGSLFWYYEWESMCPSAGQMNSISPFFIEPDLLFVSGGSGSVTGAASVKLLEEEGQIILQELWHNQEMNNVFNPSVSLDGYVYGFHGKILRCVDVNNGKVKWEVKGFGNGSLIAADDKLIILGEKGKLGLVVADSEMYNEVSKLQILKGRCWTPPSLANGKLYVRNQKEMICLKIKEE